MKVLLNIIRLLVLCSAAVTVVLRFVSFRYADTLSAEALRLMLVISIISAAVLLVSGAVWVILEKRREKAEK